MSAEEIPREPPDDSEGRRRSGFSDRSQQVLASLARHRRAAHFYEGALWALGDRSNPVAAESAAYCLRELIKELERDAIAPTAKPRLGDLFKSFRRKWEAADRRPGDNGLRDNCDPAIFAVDQFIGDAEAGHAAHRDWAQKTFAELDPVRRPGPPDTEKERIKRLLAFRDEFNHVLHGENPTDSEEFGSSVQSFETFLLAWIAPRTFEDFSDIDELLKEGPPT
jgi:hypothetical protein